MLSDRSLSGVLSERSRPDRPRSVKHCSTWRFQSFTFPVVSATHLKLIRDAFAEEYLGQEPTEDIDVDLHHIYSNIIAAEGKSVDLYTPPWAEKWQPSKSQRTGPGHGTHGESTAQCRRHRHGARLATKSSVSLAAKFLRPVNSDISFDNLKSIVDKDYSTVNYTARKEKTEEFYSFLTQMNPGDLVVTVSQGQGLLRHRHGRRHIRR